MISSSASASSSSSREDVLPGTPSSDRGMILGAAAGPGAGAPTPPLPPITPQNPFDAIAPVSSSASGGPAASPADFLLAVEQTPPRTPTTGAAAGAAAAAIPASLSAAGSSVSAPTTPVSMKGAPTLPQSAPPMMHSNATALNSAMSPGLRRPDGSHPASGRLPPASSTVPSAASASAAAPSMISFEGAIPHQPVFDDDENTEPSSANNSQQQQRHEGVDPAVVAGSFARFLETTRRRLSSASHRGREQSASDDDVLDASEGVLIAGYLQKLGRNGKWQARWFETDGECLSYYKSSKRTKLLATLDLAKVGHIGADESDSQGRSFSIQVLGRLYHLRADSRASCKDWVITLNRVKEARLNLGNTKLVHDLLEPAADAVAPRVVVVANRQRTRAVDESQDWDNMMNAEDSNPAVEATYDPFDHKRRSAIGNVVLARWTKRRTSLSRLGAKLARWARSLKKYHCTDVETDPVVQLDRHVHPPGHDDKTKKRPPVQPASVPQPSRVTRAFSAASEDDARFIA